jgi:hypothetical protein
MHFVGSIGRVLIRDAPHIQHWQTRLPNSWPDIQDVGFWCIPYLGCIAHWMGESAKERIYFDRFLMIFCWLFAGFFTVLWRVLLFCFRDFDGDWRCFDGFSTGFDGLLLVFDGFLMGGRVQWLSRQQHAIKSRLFVPMRRTHYLPLDLLRLQKMLQQAGHACNKVRSVLDCAYLGVVVTWHINLRFEEIQAHLLWTSDPNHNGHPKQKGISHATHVILNLQSIWDLTNQSYIRNGAFGVVETAI